MKKRDYNYGGNVKDWRPNFNKPMEPTPKLGCYTAVMGVKTSMPIMYIDLYTGEKQVIFMKKDKWGHIYQPFPFIKVQILIQVEDKTRPVDTIFTTFN